MLSAEALADPETIITVMMIIDMIHDTIAIMLRTRATRPLDLASSRSPRFSASRAYIMQIHVLVHVGVY